MKLTFLVIGKTVDSHLQALIGDYQKRLGFYMPFDYICIPELKNTKNLSEAEVFDAYRRMVEVICATDDISKLLSGAKEMSSSDNDVVKQNGKAMMAMVKEISLNRQIMANTLKLRIADMNLAEDMKNSLLSKLNGLVEFLENDVDKSSGSTLTGKQLFFIIGWMLIFLCAIITMLT